MPSLPRRPSRSLLLQTRSWLPGGSSGTPVSTGFAAVQLPWEKPTPKPEPVPGKPAGWVPFPRVPFPVSKEPVPSPKDKASKSKAQVSAVPAPAVPPVYERVCPLRGRMGMLLCLEAKPPDYAVNCYVPSHHACQSISSL